MINKKRFIALFLTLFLTLQAYGQDAAPAAGASSDDIVGDSFQDLSIVLGVALGGAILGLSTLSFVEEPKEHLSNIVTGGAIGIIVGVAIVAYNQAMKGQESYQESAKFENLSTHERMAWHYFESKQNLPKNESPLLMTTFSF